MIPIRDSIPSRRRPLVVYTLVALNALVFWHELSLGEEVVHFFYTYGLVARDFWATESAAARFGPVLTSMFLHAGWVHFLSNMLFLWVFGDNVEDRMGRGRFTVFYLSCGAVAAFAQLVATPHSSLPMVGASGAIAGVLGAYLRLFPRSRILAVVPFFIFLHFLEVPAFFFLVYWFLIQLASGTLALAAGSVGGVAFWAHIGGFAAGFILCPIFRRRPRIEVLPPWW